MRQQREATLTDADFFQAVRAVAIIVAAIVFLASPFGWIAMLPLTLFAP